MAITVHVDPVQTNHITDFRFKLDIGRWMREHLYQTTVKI